MDASENAPETSRLYPTYLCGEQPFVKSVQVLTGNQRFTAGLSLCNIDLSQSTNVRILVSIGCTMNVERLLTGYRLEPPQARALDRHTLYILQDRCPSLGIRFLCCEILAFRLTPFLGAVAGRGSRGNLLGSWATRRA